MVDVFASFNKMSKTYSVRLDLIIGLPICAAQKHILIVCHLMEYGKINRHSLQSFIHVYGMILKTV